MTQREHPVTRIREVRRQRKMTLKDLATALDTTPQTVQRLETGNMTMSLAWLGKIAMALGVEPGDLLLASEAGIDDNAGDASFIRALRAEATIARRKFPSSEFAGLALMEEVGELAQALLQWRMGQTDWLCVVEEAVQVATMAMRIATEGDPTVAPHPGGRKPVNGAARALAEAHP